MTYSTERFFVFEEMENRYVIEVTETEEGLKYTLLYSNTNCWQNHVKGNTIFVALDDGDGLKFEQALGHVMDYGIADELTLFLDFISSRNLKPSKYTYVAQKYFLPLTAQT